jgi:hypothetical protein
MRIRSPEGLSGGLIFIAIGGGFILLAQQYRLATCTAWGRPCSRPWSAGAGRARRRHRAALVS